MAPNNQHTPVSTQAAIYDSLTNSNASASAVIIQNAPPPNMDLTTTTNWKLHFLLKKQVRIKFLGIPNPTDLHDWVESDQVSPFFAEFVQSWLDPNVNDVGSGSSIASLSRLGYRVVHRSPSAYNVRATLAHDLVSEEVERQLSENFGATTSSIARGGKRTEEGFWPTRGGGATDMDTDMEMDSVGVNKTGWRAEEHWARFIMQVYYGADGTSTITGTSPGRSKRSLWPGARETFSDKTIKGLYLLLYCLVLAYYRKRKNEVLLGRAEGPGIWMGRGDGGF